MSDKNTNHSIIGGMFGLHVNPDPVIKPPPFLVKEYLQLVNARSCIWYLINALAPENVWVPSYLCHTIIDATIKTQADVQFYEIDDQLRIPSDDWNKFVKKGDLVVFIEYFGFPIEISYSDKAKNSGAWVLVDSSQALLSSNNIGSADFSIFSPRKFIGIVDGGILRINCDYKIDELDLKDVPESWWLKAFSASLQRRDFDHHFCDERDWYTLFQETENVAPIDGIRMSEFSSAIMRNHFNYRDIGDKRRENYLTLSRKMKDYAIFPELPDTTVPLGFPIRFSDRKSVREYLFSLSIYPPVHWQLQGHVPNKFNKSHELAAEIMTLPCDQRYNEYQMNRMADHILKFIS